MPSPKSGNACSLISPVSPRAAQDADKADPGEMNALKSSQRQTQTGKYGSTPITAHKAPQTETGKAKKPSWIEIQLVDQDNKPVPGEPYRVTLPDGSTVAEGTLDEKGLARVEGIDPGNCQITFPQQEKHAWNPV